MQIHYVGKNIPVLGKLVLCYQIVMESSNLHHVWTFAKLTLTYLRLNFYFGIISILVRLCLPITYS